VEPPQVKWTLGAEPGVPDHEMVPPANNHLKKPNLTAQESQEQHLQVRGFSVIYDQRGHSEYQE
jgi:hypothetical protein